MAGESLLFNQLLEGLEGTQKLVSVYIEPEVITVHCLDFLIDLIDVLQVSFVNKCFMQRDASCWVILMAQKNPHQNN